MQTYEISMGGTAWGYSDQYSLLCVFFLFGVLTKYCNILPYFFKSFRVLNISYVLTLFISCLFSSVKYILPYLLLVTSITSHAPPSPRPLPQPNVTDVIQTVWTGGYEDIVGRWKWAHSGATISNFTNWAQQPDSDDNGIYFGKLNHRKEKWD